MKKTFNSLLIVLLGCLIISFFTSCSQKLAYFDNIQRDSVATVQVQTLQTVINKNDLLQIKISTLSETDMRLLNNDNANSASLAVTTNSIPNGYLVDESGIIKMPMLGVIKAEGLTKTQLATFITNELTTKGLAKDPIVSVRIVNYKITVLGEVNHPSVISVPNEHITLPEALGEANDLTPYGRRDNVLLIREVGGKRIYKRFSLNKDQLFDKDIYNLQNQDIIYVEPNKARGGSVDRTTQILPIVLSSLSILVLLYVQLFRK